MADDFQTLAKLLVINDQNLSDIEMSDILDAAPILAALPADEASNGTLHKYLKETTAPTVGFRLPNQGRENTASNDTLATVTLKILDASFSVDKALATPYKKGPEAYVAREGKRHLKAAFFEAEKQLLNGTGNATDGFSGLADELNDNDDAMVIDATGSTQTTGSSVWAIRGSDDGSDAQVIAGNDGKIIMGETVEQAIEDTVNGGRFTGLYTSILGWLGMQIGGARSIGRICNLTAQAGKGLTDDLIAQLLALFPAAKPPTLLGMNRRSRRQLQQSRTAVNATGAPAPFPVEAYEIPIITTDAIGSTETLLTAA